jgi:nucleoside-diphosphate-sugar epimerase
MCVPIIRPKSFVGPERLGVFALFYDWAKDGKNFPVLGSAATTATSCSTWRTCATAIYLAATLPSARVNDVFNIGAKEFTTIKEDYQAVLDYAGSRAQDRLDPRRAGDLDAARAGEGEPIAAVPVGLRDSDRRLVCVD